MSLEHDSTADENEEEKLKQYLKYKNLLKYLLIPAGVWSDREAQPWSLRIFLRFFSGLAALSVCYHIIMFFLKEAITINDYMRGLGFIIGFWSIFIKMCFLAIFQNDLEYLDKNVSASFERDIKDPEKQKHSMKHFSVVSNICLISLGIYCLGYILMYRIVITLALKGIYIKLFPVHFPFTIDEGGTLYWASLLYQTYGCFYLTTLSVGSDSVFGYYSLHVIGELSVLSEDYRNLKSNDDYSKNLKACIRRHRMIQKSLPILEKIFGFLTIWLAITCATAICSQIWQVSKMKTISMSQAFFIVLWAAAKFTQSFSYAYNGYAITCESEKCLEAIYDSEWPGSGDKRFMKDVTIMLTQKPMVFNAMGFMNLGFEMFMKTCNASLSYYMLLKTMEAKYNG